MRVVGRGGGGGVGLGSKDWKDSRVMTNAISPGPGKLFQSTIAILLLILGWAHIVIVYSMYPLVPSVKMSFKMV